MNVTTAAQLCSTALGQGRGRCLRQDSTADVFLPLNSTSFQLRRRDGDHPQRPLFWAEGQPSSADTLFLRLRNWASVDIYQQKSEELVRQQHPQWPPELVKETAKQQLEQSARNFVEQTLWLGETLRPNGYWGF